MKYNEEPNPEEYKIKLRKIFKDPVAREHEKLWEKVKLLKKRKLESTKKQMKKHISYQTRPQK